METLSHLREMNSSEFVSEYLFDRISHIFGHDRALYVQWKCKLGGLVEVDPACLKVVGSAGLGMSLNPSKGFRVFDEKSDVDVAVVSHYHFTASWRFLRANGHLRTHVDEKTRIAWDEHVRRYVYWGTIATDRLLGILPFGKQWLQAINEMNRLAPTLGRDINLRIYADYEALRAYQVHSTTRAREEVLTGE
ncbi:MAG: hypothetical protein KF751_18920 [Nitrospira sp.]|nr:hypothetical protein [Nitrospira sp.]